MALVRAQISLHGVSGLPEDVFQNNLWFQTGTDPFEPGDLTAIVDAIELFFNDRVSPNTSEVAGYISPEVSRTNLPTVDIYDEGGGSPIHSDTIALDAVINNERLPNEVALCLSFHADLTNLAEEVPGGEPGPGGDTRPRARRRGRIFVGPLNTAAIDIGTGRPTATFQDVLRDAGKALVDSTTLDAAGVTWEVAHKQGPGNYDGNGVVGGWVDDAFDTQRRRGLAPTSRVTFLAA